MSFVPASPESIVAFLSIVFFNVGFFLVSLSLAERREGREPGCEVANFSFLLGAWIGITALFVNTGAIAIRPFPFLMIFFLLMNCGALALGLSRIGKTLATTPLWALVAFQGFRLPLELVLHSWAEQGTIPSTMTWTGQNWDIITGITALACAPLASQHKAAAWVANVVGIALLLNVMRVAMMSSPLPFAWGTQPPLLLAMRFPYALIVPICVGGALAGHVVLTRALLGKK